MMNIINSKKNVCVYWISFEIVIDIYELNGSLISCLIVKKKITCMFDFSWNNRAERERERETRQRKFKPVELETRAHACHRRCKMFLEKNGGKREKKKSRARLETIVLPACENLNWWQRSSVLKLITAWQVDVRTHRHGSGPCWF